MARVHLRNSYRYKGVMYHPGAAVEVPDALALALGLTDIGGAVAEEAPPAELKPKKPAVSRARKAKPTTKRGSTQ